MWKKCQIAIVNAETSLLHKYIAKFTDNNSFRTTPVSESYSNIHATRPVQLLIVSQDSVTNHDMVGIDRMSGNIRHWVNNNTFLNKDVHSIVSAYPNTLDKRFSKIPVKFIEQFCNKPMYEVWIEYFDEMEFVPRLLDDELRISMVDPESKTNDFSALERLKIELENKTKNDFSETFKSKINHSPLNRHITMALDHGSTLHEIIEQLVDVIENQQKAYKELIEKLPIRLTQK